MKHQISLREFHRIYNLLDTVTNKHRKLKIRNKAGLKKERRYFEIKQKVNIRIE